MTGFDTKLSKARLYEMRGIILGESISEVKKLLVCHFLAYF